MPRHLLIIAHGSRRQASNDEVRRLGERVAGLRSPGIDRVQVAFLELAEPDIAAGLRCCAMAGATEIIVLPYFLAAGTHVAEDIPAELARFADSHPHIQLRLTAHLGASAALPRAMLDMATDSGHQPVRPASPSAQDHAAEPGAAAEPAPAGLMWISRCG